MRGRGDRYEHYKRTLPSGICLFADRLWNHSVSDYDYQYGCALTKLLLGINVPKDFNVFQYFGGVLPPLNDKELLWKEKSVLLTKKDKEILEKLSCETSFQGSLAKVYLECLDYE